MILRLATRYLALFIVALAALAAGAYVFVERQYRALLGPALATPEGTTAFAHAMQHAALTIAAIALPLLVVFGVVSYVLAAFALEPLLAARARERSFAADAAHALRAPLASIASVAQARRPTASAGDAEAFETIAAASLDASAIVTDLLTLARAAEAQSLEREPVDLGAICANTVREFSSRAASRGVTLDCSPASAIIDGDERRLRDMLRNLLDNALRYASTSIRLEMATNGSDASVTVWNDGEPVPPEVRPRVFERLYTHDSAGAGLGLAVVEWIARAHGGTVALSDGGSGTAFVVRLPLMRMS